MKTGIWFHVAKYLSAAKRSQITVFHRGAKCFGAVAMLALVLAFLADPAARAQVLYGSLTGTVTDPSGAVVPGAQVKAVDVATGVTATATSDSSGIYRLPNLLPGAYTVTISASGFATQQTPNVPVRANEIARIDATLQVAKTATSVTVTTAPPLLQTDTADVHTDISSQQIQNLPLMGTQGGNFQELLRSVPGAGLTGEPNSLAGNPQRSILVNMNGQSQQENNTRIDGVLDAYPYLPADTTYIPPEDAIETANVATNSFTAEQGLAGGAAVNVQMKSGTNSFHGDAHEFHTDQNFAARNYFYTDPVHYPHKNRNNQNQFGGAVGGPILKNKLFFFFDFERTTQRNLAGPDVTTLPTAAMATGDFRNLPADSNGNVPTIYDPATGASDGTGKQIITCNSVQNVICPNRIDPAAQAMVALLQPEIAKEFPTSNDQGNWTGSGTALFNRNNSDSKIDYVISQNTKLWGRYSFSKSLVYDPPLLGAAVGNSTGGGQLGNAPGLVQLVGIGATHTFTPNLLFDWNLGYTRQRLGSTFDLTSARGLDTLKIPGTNNAGATGDPSLYYGWPGFTFPTGGASLGNAQPANPFLFRDDQIVTGVNLTWIKGRHSLRGGFEWDHSLVNHFQPQGGTFQSPRGVFQFNGNATAGTTPNWFNSWADFLLGLPGETGKARALFNPTALRWSQWAWYAQDQWQVTPKWTLTAGIRWEYHPFGYSDNGKGLRWFNLNDGNVYLGGYGGVPKDDGIDVGIGQFLPRVGAAYRIRPTTVIRVGYGLSAEPYNYEVLANSYPSVVLDDNKVGNSDFIPIASLTGTNGSNLGSGSYSVPTGLVLQPLPALSSGKIPLPTSVNTTTLPNPFHRGYINSYNLTVEQEFGHNFTFDVGYVGDYDIGPVVNMNANASPPGTGSAGGLLSQRLGVNYTAGGINELNPFQHSRYDALQTSFKYLFDHGSTLNVAYTWSKDMDYADNEDLGYLMFPYPTNWQKNYAPSSFDRTNNLEITSVFALPFGHDQPWVRSGVGGAVLGGWLVAPELNAMSGIPFTVTAGGSPNGSLNANGATQTADQVAPIHLTHGKPPRAFVTCAQTDPTCHYFAASSFAAPWICTNPGSGPKQCGTSSPSHFGNTKRDEFRGPSYFSMGASIVRDFKVREWATLQVRGEAVNLTNTPHFNNPNTGCPADGTTPGPVAGSGQLCSTGNNNSFGVVTSVIQPGGYFGPDPGNRVIWLGASVTF